MFTFLRAEARWIFAGFLLTAFSGFGQTFFISQSNAALRDIFALSHGGLGLTYSAATLTSALVLLQLGKLVDRVSTRRAALIVATGLVVACLIMAGAVAVWMLFLAFFLLRLFGQGMMTHVAMVATGRWFDAQRGKAVSLVATGFAISLAILPPLAVVVILSFGLRTLWLMGAGIVALIAMPALYLLLARERAPKGHASTTETAAPKASWRRAEVLREPSLYLLMLSVLAPSFLVTGVFFHQQHLAEVKDWPLATFAAGFPVFAILQTCGSLAAGLLVDRFSARALLPTFLVPVGIALCLPFWFDGLWVIVALMALLGLGAGVHTTLSGAIWPEMFGVRYLGEIRALIFSAAVASSAASPMLLGYLIDLGISLPLQLAVLGGYALLASAVMGIIQPRLSAIANDRITPTRMSESLP